MNRFCSSTSVFALAAAGVIVASPLVVQAASFDVTTATTTQQRVSGTDVGVIANTGSITVSGVAVQWNGAATGGGITVTNDGTVTSTNGRAFDTNGSSITGPYTLINNGTIASSNDTFRVNDDLAGGTLTVTNNGAMTSATGQVFDLTNANAASATFVLTNTNTISAADSDTIRLGSGTITVTNSGTITSVTDKAIVFDEEGNVENLVSFTLTNEAGGEIIGADDAVKISADADNNASAAIIAITNHGLIDGGEGQAIDFADLTSADNVITITNYGTLQSAQADGLRPGAGATVINYGLIQSTDLTSDGDGVDFQEFGGTVVNKAGGEILAAKHGITGDGAIDVTNELGASITGQNGSGINVDSVGDTVVTVTNYGTITGAVTGLLDDDGAADGVPDGDGDGIDVDGYLELNNYGTVQGTGATGTNDGTPNTADGIAAGGGIIYNQVGGVIRAYDNYANDGSDNVGRAILIDDSSQGPAPFATIVINKGTIVSDGVAVTFIGANDDSINNYGLIQSENAMAVDMGDGNDLFIYNVGSQVIGYVTGGAGSDTFQLQGAGSFDLGQLGDTAAYRDFETLFVGAGSDFTATGTSSFAGDIVVDGTLVFNGSLASASLTIENGATLSGNSTFGNLNVAAGGTVAPGNSIGTITVNGTVSFAAGSTYEVELDQTSSDQIVAGTSDITGGTVVVSILGGPVTAGTVYTIISAQTTTSATGQFDTLIAPDFVFIDPTLGRDGADVTLTLARNNVTFASLANTANQASVANAIDAAGGGALYSYLVAATPGQEVGYAAGYDLLSGEVHASLGNTLFNQSTLVADTLVARLRQASAGASPEMAALATGGPVTAYAAKAKGPASPIVVKAPALAPVGPVYTAWAQGFGQWNTADGNANAASVDGSLGGFLAGGDVTSSNVTFGLAAGYASASSDVDARLSSADASTVIIAAYTGASFEAFRLRGGASYGWSDVDTQRTASIAGITENPLGSYDGSTVNIFAEAAYAVEMGGVAFEPFAQMAWSWIDTDSFTETGAPMTGLSSSGLSFDVPYSTLGLRLAKSFEVGAGTLTPHASFAWRHAYGDVTPEIAMAFTDTGSSFGVAGAPIAEDSFVFGAGVDFSVGQNVSLNIGYEGQFASQTETNAIKGGFTYRF